MSDELFTREEVQAGLTARRARTLLFVIEGRTAYLNSRREVRTVLMATPELVPWIPVFVGEMTVPLEDMDGDSEVLFRVFSRERQGLPAPSLAELEAQAPQWRDLVPDHPRLCAGVVRLLASKHRLVRKEVPRLRAALGMDREAVQAAFERAYGVPLESVYMPSVSLMDRVRQFFSGKP
jgi:hypothetical protein